MNDQNQHSNLQWDIMKQPNPYAEVMTGVPFILIRPLLLLLSMIRELLLVPTPELLW